MTIAQSSPPKVTICLPTLGRLTYIEATLKSLKDQTLRDSELVILYNGTNPEHLQTLRRLAADHPRGRVLPDPVPLPMFANFNRGLRESRGEYVVFFHDDDEYEPEFLKRIVELLDASPSAAFAGSNYFITDSKGRITGHRRLIRETRVQRGLDFIEQMIHRGRSAVPTPGIVFRRTALGTEGWDERLSMHFGDFVVLMRLAERWDALLIAEPLMRLRLHDANASNVKMSDAAPMQYEIMRSYITEFQARHPEMQDLVKSLQAGARKSLMRNLTWGWLSQQNGQEAERCIELLVKNGATKRATVMKMIGRAGFNESRRRGVAKLVRRIGRFRG